MKEPHELPSLESLTGKLNRLQEKVSPQARPGPQGLGLAMQMGLELVAGVAVGAGAGIMLDRWLHTSPVLLVVCFFLGAGGGFLTMYRAAAAMKTDGERKEERDTKSE